MEHVICRLAPASATILVTLIAIRAVVHVASHALVLLVGLRLQVAVGAGED